MSPSQMLAKLKKLSQDAGNNYFQRIEIVDELLRDRDWLTSSFKGDVYQAADTLEQDYFHDLSGSMTMWQLLHIYRKFPSEQQWKRENYNLKNLYSKCKAPRDEQTRRAVTIAAYEAMEQRFKEADFRVKALTKQVTELGKVKEENDRLKGRIEELERIVRNKLAG